MESLRLGQKLELLHNALQYQILLQLRRNAVDLY